MPKRDDLNSILIIGAGPIIIGQACEFDYSGTQACKSLREEGYRIILLNSNPATIMTDPNLADATYLEPITITAIEEIIKKEKPSAILPTVGGQTALDLAIQLEKNGLLQKYDVELIGANVQAIEIAEDREKFKSAMHEVGIETAAGRFASSIDEAMEIVREIPFPIIIRPSFTMGGTGGSTAYNIEEFSDLVDIGLNASPIHQVLIEESLLGWKEYEMEVVRDRADNAVIVCSIENLDPMGIHTGDSITVAPAQTLSDKEYQKMRNWSIKCLRKIGVDTGGSNVQFAVNPQNGRMIIIEMNPRVSRSSALASKATGYPIAKVAAKLAVGYLLDEIRNDITGYTTAAFEPVLDYVVTKIPRFDFEKFPSADGTLGVQMQSVGEVMAIGRTFPESLQKAFRSLETGLSGIEPKKTPSRDLSLYTMRFGTAFRVQKIWSAFKQGRSLKELHDATSIDPWFLHHIRQLYQKTLEFSLRPECVILLKKNGFSDIQIATMSGKSEDDIRSYRKIHGILPVYKIVDTCAAEFESQTPYCYSTYEQFDEIEPLDGKKIIILGSGPNRIGQGLEFDYCCVQAVFGLQSIGYKTIMVNCNPETVSTDFDISDRLYFEPLTYEDVMNIVDFEKPDGVLIQFGGQTPLNIASRLKESGVSILGTSPDAIDLAENRQKFGEILTKLQIPVPDWGTATTVSEAIVIAEKIGFPVLVRPSYVLGGRGMEIVYDGAELERYVENATEISGNYPILIDSFLEDAFEFDVDALCDGSDVYIAGIMQHIEEAGIHSGDSACVIPPYWLPKNSRLMIEDYTRQLALSLNTIGLVNIQFAMKHNTIYVIEVNPRASRTVPFISKVINIPIAKIASQLAAGKKLSDFDLLSKKRNHLIAIKKPVFPFNKFPGENVFLSPEMRSTGEVIGIDSHLGAAYAKAEIGSGNRLPKSGIAFISVNDEDKIQVVSVARDLLELDFELVATSGTAALLNENGLPVAEILKATEGRPNILDAIKNGEIHLIINTPMGKWSRRDEYMIGRDAVRHSVPAITTISGARAAVRAIRAIQSGKIRYHSLQEIFN
ncbi:MAG: carbamoyl-phosphate synthase large subunit [Candidatus Marinimicrobia bacterium]|jgi:carbamoyl-phosphate synthase large subunit|nr:carbamoyl-phosphate synthase large subunit [Candidatus Neomarinimicrobiota bacterium]MBT3633205.1 carbamoyl-phosphate synthase large subunit [Candidatus Neomarinimicrobiota bacterium]MBT3682194.1 carbamoyl-phosphate synthase large subunit [Candidatus Neomarinimicrobiota bacterium]MBT3758805.1 carbamoyl-phosphate synthase large subunit [Candidatus Neomarinimicrobiota bacterium]MBT3895320.1 carbamoyl-phosphate synthase large subunit [Candidatus Neomarinimicrobiota bacterium]